MASAAGTASDLVDGVRYLLDNVLGFDATNQLVKVHVSWSAITAGKPHLTIQLNAAVGVGVKRFIDLLPLDIDPDRLVHDETFDLQKEVRARLQSHIAKYVQQLISDLKGPERGVVVAATHALENLLANKILEPISNEIARSILTIEMPNREARARKRKGRQ